MSVSAKTTLKSVSGTRGRQRRPAVDGLRHPAQDRPFGGGAASILLGVGHYSHLGRGDAIVLRGVLVWNAGQPAGTVTLVVQMLLFVAPLVPLTLLVVYFRPREAT